jgi:predicted CDP-diglyceride synthetase/phosphatidate cytidylyltransferase
VNTLTTRSSRIRWLILALLFLISVVTYIDRVNISMTARQMMLAYGITDQEMGQEKRGRAELAQYADH